MLVDPPSTCYILGVTGNTRLSRAPVQASIEAERGDEFFCVVPEWQVLSVCETIRSSLWKEDEFTVSQGVVMTLINGLTQEAVSQADAAMYRS